MYPAEIITEKDKFLKKKIALNSFVSSFNLSDLCNVFMREREVYYG